MNRKKLNDSREMEIFNAMKYNRDKNYHYYIVTTKTRRSGEMKISDKKAEYLKTKYGTA